MSSKREREYERRRLEKWQERQARARARRRHRQRLGLGIGSAVAVVAIVVVLVISLNRDGGKAAAAPSATPSGQATISTAARTGNGGVLPDKSLAQNRTWTAKVITNKGDITMTLDGAAAPQAVANFVTLAGQGYFDSTKCHRLVTSGIYVLQCGDPTATGTGGPGYSWGPIENAPADNVYKAGTVAMARQSGNGSSMGSQFFLVYADSTIPSDSAGGYTVFGHITSGQDVLKAIADAGTVTVGTTTAPASDVIIEGVETQ
ncbi:MAG: peptidylprolyl isomerase [Cellulomonas sp. 73-145]|uniref:peptidylprolyl isomerase n=1 Tax=Cellulomonas sp. 73-145 TaxID=1895739 RepID=UPI00092B819B|nr:peptidylprolyl isomerase [Cellulomonas sp. 73-145]OJV57669.1 MAG: peptidylprolyl isomerase [Cellulomonas sp. 73-145]